MMDLYILGACGSIGTQTLDVVRNHLDKYQVIGLSLGRNLELSQKIIDEFQPQIICLREKSHLEHIKTTAKVVYGDKGLIEVSTFGKAKNSILVNALVGSAGLLPTVKAILHHRDIALANKETLVMAGDIINSLLKEHNVELYPIDSEHSAIWQCLQGESISDVKRLIITASGGSFRDKTREELLNATKADALKHPNWSMGSKITIDSATMMNKGFEVIEAHHLFNLPYDKITTVLHRQSIVHSLVEYNDGAVKAQLGTPDMRVPIQYALTNPRRYSYSAQGLDLLTIPALTFEKLSMERYPCLGYAYEAGKKGGIYPTILNAANEAAVHLFLEGKIKFLDIESIISAQIAKNYTIPQPTLEEILEMNESIYSAVIKQFGGK